MIPELIKRLGPVTLVVALALTASAQGRRGAPVLKVVDAERRAVVSVDGVRHGRVGDDGSKMIEGLKPGRRTVAVRQVGYVDSLHTITLAAGPAVTVRPKRVALRDEAELARQRGEDLALDGKHTQAVAEYRFAIAEREGKYLEAQVGLTRSLYALKRLDDALSTIIGVVNASPEHPEARTVYANVLRERGLYEDAAVEYGKAIALEPERSPEGYTGLGMALQEIGRSDEAIEAIQKGIAQNDDAEPILYQLLGSVLEHAGRRAEARIAYERFLELAPGHTLAPAVTSVLEQLGDSPEDGPEEGDGNPFARPPAAGYRDAGPAKKP